MKSTLPPPPTGTAIKKMTFSGFPKSMQNSFILFTYFFPLVECGGGGDYLIWANNDQLFSSIEVIQKFN